MADNRCVYDASDVHGGLLDVRWPLMDGLISCGSCVAFLIFVEAAVNLFRRIIGAGAR